MTRSRAAILAVLGFTMIAGALGADAPTKPESPAQYTYATNGLVDHVTDRLGDKWKLLLDKSNLGGSELEAAELTIPAGTQIGSHQHGSVEVIYVLSGTYGHEVNGKLYLLKPGMVGIVRPGDSVRHLVPKDGPTRLLIIWVPGGEAGKFFQPGKGVAPAPVAEAAALNP
jgi:quercetin dioxygenase-like cupin family protein